MSDDLPKAIRDRYLVMQKADRLTVEEARLLVKLMEPFRKMSPAIGSAFRKIEHAYEFALQREKKFFGPGATAEAPPPLKLT